MSHSSENSIDQLISLFSHELRTPITSLQGAIELLQTYQHVHRSSSPPDLEELLTLATASADRLIHVIENILDWYEITQGTPSLFQQPCNATFLLQQAVAISQPYADQQHIQLHLDAPIWIPVKADQRHLSRTLSHLIHNAIKFSPVDRQVRITATLVQPQGSTAVLDLPYVLITIQDQGIGIPDVDQDQIFQPFHQVDASDQRRYGGLGLELALCYEVIQRHQGKIWVESQLGQGSTFYVALPLEKS